MQKVKRIEKSFYAEREYLRHSFYKHKIRALYYYIKWKILERRIK